MPHKDSEPSTKNDSSLHDEKLVNQDSELDEILINLYLGDTKKHPELLTQYKHPKIVAAKARLLAWRDSACREARKDEVRKFDLNMASVYASDPVDTIVYVKRMAESRLATLSESKE